MRLKDHYKTLGISPAADAQEVKKAFRALAVKYHPDKNPDNAFAEAHFKEVQEAYATLSHTGKRRAYDEDLWLSGQGSRIKNNEAVTPQWLLKESLRLSKHMATVDTHRMNHQSLRDYILLILSDSHMGVLQTYKEPEVNRQIVMAILTAVKWLEIEYLPAITDRLTTLAGDEPALQLTIQTALAERTRQAGWDKALPIVAIVITLLLCVCMYFFAHRY
jgi:molecular chaperone DnaJ